MQNGHLRLIGIYQHTVRSNRKKISVNETSETQTGIFHSGGTTKTFSHNFTNRFVDEVQA